MAKNEANLFGVSLFAVGILFCGSAFCPISDDRQDIEIYRGTVQEASDFIVRFPTEEEAQETFERLNGVVDTFRSVLAGESSINMEDIREKCRFVIETQRKTEIMEWCLVGLCLDGSISLLPGEGIELTLPSFCLDADKAGPSEDEFFSIEQISGKESEWLTPLLEHLSRRPDEDLPAQELIWNMGKKVPYEDLPEDQQALLSAIVPDAERRYGKKLGSKLLGRLADEVKSRVEIISDFESIADQINQRKSNLELVLPRYDTFSLDNGLLVKVKSTGSFAEITLVTVNPREVGGGEGLISTPSLVRSGEANIITGHDMGIGTNHGPVFSLRAPYFCVFASPSTSMDQGKWSKGKNWWKENSGKIEDWSNRAGDIKDIIDSYHEGGLEGVNDYAKGRGFDASLDVFKSFHKGNPEVEQAFELFRSFNKDLMKAENDKQNRGNNDRLKFFRPKDYRFKPGRGDVQPLAASGRY